MTTRADPTTETFLYEKARINGPTNSPEKFIRASNVLIIRAAPVVLTPKSSNKSPNNKPNDGSIDLVHNQKKKINFLFFFFNYDLNFIFTLTILTPMTATQPYPPSGGTIFVLCSINIVVIDQLKQKFKKKLLFFFKLKSRTQIVYYLQYFSIDFPLTITRKQLHTWQ